METKGTQHPILKHNLKGHKKPITGLSFSPVCDDVASSSEEHYVMVWNLHQNSRNYQYSGHCDSVTDIAYSPNGQLLASCSKDGTVRISPSRTTKGSSCADFAAHEAPIRTLSFAPDNQKVATGSDDTFINLWSVKEQFLGSFIGHEGCVRSAQFSEDGKTIASCSDDLTVRVWDSNSYQNVHSFKMKRGPTSVSFHPNGNSLAVGVSSGSVRVYDIRMQKLQQHYVLHEATTSVCWHPLANYFVSCGREGKIVVVDSMKGGPCFTIKGHKGAMSRVRFSNDGKLFASGGDDGFVFVWESNLPE